MATYVALLRGINVGGRNKVPMAGLRAAVSSLGYQDVTTYIQSGNVFFSTPDSDTPDSPTTVLAEAIGAEISRTFGLNIDVVVVSKQDLERIIGDSPYPPEPRLVHVVFLAAEPGQGMLDKIAAIAAAKGGTDSVTAIGRALFVHTPDGYGSSELAKALVRLPGTARNWATTTKLLEIIGS